MSFVICTFCDKPSAAVTSLTAARSGAAANACEGCVAALLAYQTALYEGAADERIEALEDELLVRGFVLERRDGPCAFCADEPALFGPAVGGLDIGKRCIEVAANALDRERPGSMLAAVGALMTAPLAPSAGGEYGEAGLGAPVTAPDFRMLSHHGSRFEADGVVALLRGCGIDALTSGGDLGGANPMLAETFGIQVLVDVSRLEEARAILAAGQTAPAEAPAIKPPGKLYGVVKVLWLACVVLLALISYHNWSTGELAPDALWVPMVTCGMSAFWLTILYAYLRVRRRRR